MKKELMYGIAIVALVAMTGLVSVQPVRAAGSPYETQPLPEEGSLSTFNVEARNRTLEPAVVEPPEQLLTDEDPTTTITNSTIQYVTQFVSGILRVLKQIVTGSSTNLVNGETSSFTQTTTYSGHDALGRPGTAVGDGFTTTTSADGNVVTTNDSDVHYVMISGNPVVSEQDSRIITYDHLSLTHSDTSQAITYTLGSLGEILDAAGTFTGWSKNLNHATDTHGNSIFVDGPEERVDTSGVMEFTLIDAINDVRNTKTTTISITTTGSSVAGGANKDITGSVTENSYDNFGRIDVVMVDTNGDGETDTEEIESRSTSYSLSSSLSSVNNTALLNDAAGTFTSLEGIANAVPGTAMDGLAQLFLNSAHPTNANTYSVNTQGTSATGISNSGQVLFNSTNHSVARDLVGNTQTIQDSNTDITYKMIGGLLTDRIDHVEGGGTGTVLQLDPTSHAVLGDDRDQAITHLKSTIDYTVDQATNTILVDKQTQDTYVTDTSVTGGATQTLGSSVTYFVYTGTALTDAWSVSSSEKTLISPTPDDLTTPPPADESVYNVTYLVNVSHYAVIGNQIASAYALESWSYEGAYTTSSGDQGPFVGTYTYNNNTGHTLDGQVDPSHPNPHTTYDLNKGRPVTIGVPDPYGQAHAVSNENKNFGLNYGITTIDGMHNYVVSDVTTAMSAYLNGYSIPTIPLPEDFGFSSAPAGGGGGSIPVSMSNGIEG